MRLALSVDVEEEGLSCGRYPREAKGVDNVAGLQRLHPWGTPPFDSAERREPAHPEFRLLAPRPALAATAVALGCSLHGLLSWRSFRARSVPA